MTDTAVALQEAIAFLPIRANHGRTEGASDMVVGRYARRKRLALGNHVICHHDDQRLSCVRFLPHQLFSLDDQTVNPCLSSGLVNGYFW